MRKLPWMLSAAVLILPAIVEAQGVVISTKTPQVGEEISVQLDRQPGRQESITWRVETGKGDWIGDATSWQVKFRPTSPGPIVIVCVINAPDGTQRRPSANFTANGAALPPPPAPAPRPAANPTRPAPAPHAPAGAVPAERTLALEDIEYVVPTGWMGDAVPDNGGTASLDAGHTTNCRTHKSCYRVDYKPGTAGWAAFAWQRVPQGTMNWGEYPGADLSREGYRSLRIWARGDLTASGGTPPKAQFKSGGNVTPKAAAGPASYTVSGPTVELSDWQEICLDLRDKDLSNVVSPLTVVMTKVANPKTGTVVIDDVMFSTRSCSAQ